MQPLNLTHIKNVAVKRELILSAIKQEIVTRTREILTFECNGEKITLI
jgi:hypothetical protein